MYPTVHTFFDILNFVASVGNRQDRPSPFVRAFQPRRVSQNLKATSIRAKSWCSTTSAKPMRADAGQMRAEADRKRTTSEPKRTEPTRMRSRSQPSLAKTKNRSIVGERCEPKPQPQQHTCERGSERPPNVQLSANVDPSRQTIANPRHSTTSKRSCHSSPSDSPSLRSSSPSIGSPNGRAHATAPNLKAEPLPSPAEFPPTEPAIQPLARIIKLAANCISALAAPVLPVYTVLNRRLLTSTA